MPRRIVSIEDYFHSRYSVDKKTGCWNWNGADNGRGYGEFSVGVGKNRKRYLAHRVSVEINRGPIAEGLFVCHKCDNRKCVNPDHLFLGTCKDNLMDMAAKGRSTRGTKDSQAKLTDPEVLAIREMMRRFPPAKSRKAYSSGIGIFLADWFGVSRAEISTIHKGNRWGWLS